MLNAAKKLWRGEETLARAFWLWGVAGNLILLAATFSHEILFMTVPVISTLYLPYSLIAGFKVAAKSDSYRASDAKIVAFIFASAGIVLLGGWWLLIIDMFKYDHFKL